MAEEFLKTDAGADVLAGDAGAAAAAETPPPASTVATMSSPAPPAGASPPVSDWSPLKNPVFRALWIASAVSYIGYEIRNYAAPLLMGDFINPFGSCPRG